MQMALFSKENGEMESLMAREHFIFQMDLSTQAVGRMANMTVMECMSLNLKLHMMGCGHKGCTMDKALSHGLMVLIILETGSIARRQVLESM